MLGGYDGDCTDIEVTAFPVASLGLLPAGQAGSLAERGMHMGNPVKERTLKKRINKMEVHSKRNKNKPRVLGIDRPQRISSIIRSINAGRVIKNSRKRISRGTLADGELTRSRIDGSDESLQDLELVLGDVNYTADVLAIDDVSEYLCYLR